ncbi:MAG: outer membrane beta-barrel protein [Bacteroidota bacterium]
MKRLIFTALLGAAATGVFAQTASTTTATDSVSKKKGKYSFTLGIKENNRDSTSKKRSKAPGFSMGLTFSRFDLGLTALIDNGSTRLSPQNEFLRYRSWKTSNVGFDVFQAGYRFTPAFKMYVAGGFDWELIRLREDITIQRTPDMSGLKYTKDPIDYDKNRFSSAYLRIPIMFDFRSNDDKDGKKWHYVLGPELGVLLTGRVKQISDENGKQKMNYDYHFTKFRYGAVLRVGHGSSGLFAKYYFNDMFNTDAQKGLKNASIGFTVGF